jgi:hypothetical protein
MNDLMGGHVPSLIASAPTATGFMREGRIRALAVTGARRSPFDPDIPTIGTVRPSRGRAGRHALVEGPYSGAH